MPDAKYGHKHQQLRAEWKPLVDAGTVHCHHLPACRREDTLIHPGEPWDLGHRDDDPTQYTGPEHRKCNRGTAAIWKQKAQSTEEYGWFT